MSSLIANEGSKTTAQYPVARRKEYVRLYLASQPITRTRFCEQHGIGRKTLSRWIEKYSDVVKAGTVGTGNNFSRNWKAPVDSSKMVVTIPSCEYHELLRVKDKYDVIRALLQ